MPYRKLLVVAAVLASLAAVAWWFERHQASTRRLKAWELQQQDDAARARLEQPIEVAGGELSLDDLAGLISRATGLEVSVDPSVSNDKGTNAAPLVVQLPRGTFTVRSVLQIALEPNGLWADVDRHGVHITSRDNAVDLTRLRTVVYPLPQLEAGEISDEIWEEFILSIVQRQEWKDYGGPCHLESVPGALVVVQTEEGHRQIRALLAKLEQLGPARHDQQPVFLSDVADAAARQWLLQQLDMPASCAFVETPLDEALASLFERYGLPAVVDWDRLRDAGLGRDTPMTLSLDNVSLRSVLSRLLADLELTWMLYGDALMVTTPEEAEMRLAYVAYPVRDLVQSRGGADFGTLIDLVTSSIAPDTWNDVGGPGSIWEFGDGWLIVGQTEYTHRELAPFLSQLRLVLNGDPPPRMAFAAPLSARERKIREILARPLDLEFADTPLDEACRRLADAMDVPIVIDVRRLAEEGVSTGSPVTLPASATPALQRLRTMLVPLGLKPLIGDDILLITTAAEAKWRISTRIYDARAIIGTQMSGVSLIEQIKAQAGPDTWIDTGGPGEIVLFRGLLVVGQTDEVHEEVEQFLLRLEQQEAPLPEDDSVPEESP